MGSLVFFFIILQGGIMDAVTVFNFNQSQVRTVIRNGEPWFVAKDICDILELENVSRALSTLGDDEKIQSELGAQNQPLV